MEEKNPKKFQVAPRDIATHATPTQEETKGGGRPPIEEEMKNDKVISTYVTTDVREKLREYAKRENRTVADVVRSFIEEKVMPRAGALEILCQSSRISTTQGKTHGTNTRYTSNTATNS